MKKTEAEKAQDRKAFKKGTEVKWKTIGRGSECERRGTIIGVVPALGDPNEFCNVRHLKFGARRREQKSFIVEGDNGRVYWPVTLNLEQA
jgi:hypothetical protein